MDLISVIVPVYNVAPWLRRSVESVMKQTYRNLEIILVDDGSTDEGGAICDALAEVDDRIIVIHTENQGLSEARNTGLRMSHGSYISYIDSDDWIDKFFIEKMYNSAVKYNADLVQCRVIFEYVSKNGRSVSLEGKEAQEYSRRVLSGSEYLDWNLCRDGIFSMWSKLYKRELALQMDLTPGRLFEDVAVFGKLSGLARTVVIEPQAIYYYQENRNGSIMNRFLPYQNIDNMWAANKLVRDGIKYHPEMKSRIMQWYGTHTIIRWRITAVSASFRVVMKSVFPYKLNLNELDANTYYNIKYLVLYRRYIIKHFSDYKKKSLRSMLKAMLVIYMPLLYRQYGLFHEHFKETRIVARLQHRKRL